MLLSICGLRDIRSREGRTFFGGEGGGGARDVVIMYHETFNIPKVKNALLIAV
jgi:hypothetical protein